MHHDIDPTDDRSLAQLIAAGELALSPGCECAPRFWEHSVGWALEKTLDGAADYETAFMEVHWCRNCAMQTTISTVLQEEALPEMPATGDAIRRAIYEGDIDIY